MDIMCVIVLLIVLALCFGRDGGGYSEYHTPPDYEDEPPKPNI